MGSADGEEPGRLLAGVISVAAALGLVMVVLKDVVLIHLH